MVIGYFDGNYLMKFDSNERYLLTKNSSKLPMLSTIKKEYAKVPATLISTVMLHIVFNGNLEYATEETEAYVQKMFSYRRRLKELQGGVSNGCRPIKLPDTIDYVLTPYQHQKEAIATALNLDKVALFLDLGLGKTFTSITVAKLRNSFELVYKVLCVVPRSLMAQWKDEITRFSPGSKVHVVDGTPKAKLEVLNNAIERESPLEFTLITYESLGAVLEELKLVGYDMFILDESAKIKNPQAVRTKNTVKICSTIKYGVLLTGLPYTNSPLDLYSQMMVVDPNIYGTNQYAFSNRYIVYSERGPRKFPIGAKNVDDLKYRAYFAAFSRTKEQCLDLPEKVYQTRKMPLNKDQYRWYVELLNQIYTDELSVDEIIEQETQRADRPVNINNVVSLIEKLQQVTSGFLKTDEGDYIWLDSPKFDEALSIVENSNDKFIIWAKHIYTLQKLYEMFSKIKDLPVAVLNNKVSDDERLQIKQQFKDGKIKVLILQIQSECRGNDLTCKTNSVTAIFFENTPSIEERLQAEARQHRIGMTGTAVYIDLLCEDTYDEGILKLLESKETLSSYIREQKLGLILGKGGLFIPKRSGKLSKVPKKGE